MQDENQTIAGERTRRANLIVWGGGRTVDEQQKALRNPAMRMQLNAEQELQKALGKISVDAQDIGIIIYSVSCGEDGSVYYFLTEQLARAGFDCIGDGDVAGDPGGEAEVKLWRMNADGTSDWCDSKTVAC